MGVLFFPMYLSTAVLLCVFCLCGCVCVVVCYDVCTYMYVFACIYVHMHMCTYVYEGLRRRVSSSAALRLDFILPFSSVSCPCVYSCLHLCGYTWVYVCLYTHACGSPRLVSGTMLTISLLFTEAGWISRAQS